MGSFNKYDEVTTTQTTCDYVDRNIPAGPLYFEEYAAGGNAWISDTNVASEGTLFLVKASSLVDAEEGNPASPNTHASLERVFALAVAQTRDGKGADRHGNGEPFERQPIVSINKDLGSNHGALFQVIKKATESARLAATDRVEMAKAELLGAMVYAGAAYLLLEADDGKV